MVEGSHRFVKEHSRGGVCARGRSCYEWLAGRGDGARNIYKHEDVRSSYENKKQRAGGHRNEPPYFIFTRAKRNFLTPAIKEKTHAPPQPPSRIMGAVLTWAASRVARRSPRWPPASGAATCHLPAKGSEQ